MKIKLINRKYQTGNFFRLKKMIGIKLLGYKFCIYKYELRIYL